MADRERDMIPLESDQYKSDLVINQHIMQMIERLSGKSYWSSGRSEMERQLQNPVKDSVKKRFITVMKVMQCSMTKGYINWRKHNKVTKL